MKHSIFPFLIILFLFTGLKAHSQENNSMEEKISRYPKYYKNTVELAQQIESDFKTDKERAKAAFAWIARNIAYDTKNLTKPSRIRFSYRTETELQAKKRQFRKNLALKTLHKRKALCEGYATLYQEVCQLMHLQCELVTGTARRSVADIGNTSLSSNHTWNAVKVNQKWLLVDATWAAGSVDFSRMIFTRDYASAYFASKPVEFAMKHYPDNPKWLLTKEKIDKISFAQQPMLYPAFMGKNIELLSPTKGIQHIENGETLAFKMLNLPENTSVAYHFKKEKYGQHLQIYRNKDSTIFTIRPQFKGKDELIIYFNNEPALGYQIQVK
ncbi:transglutaminase domain-containing protein [Ancylomarina longa]|uniref:Transglutaminase-like domain-containing protein n=1 Tax=Ancylomarina longa TaxID=2487017 RepID=A0A434AUW2_9BACT|nr:transglutaminase domain-containing protein [Ancylomarina longa]RUT78225.1 hypothetical protein DLK05_09100 [Ancylomarina longa]